MNDKILVAYFSASGTTARVAEEIAEATGADIYEIKAAVPYSSQDLNWMDKTSRSSVEMNDKMSRPLIGNKIHNMEQYQIVFIGFPIWWYVEPRIIDTFLESYDFSGKILIPFATSGSSNINYAESNLKKNYPTAIWKEGKLLNSGVDMKWLKKILK